LILFTPFILPTILIIGVLWIYFPILTNLFSDLVTNEDYSFGLLLPFVSGYIIYLKWPQIRNVVWRPSWLGLVFLALGLFLSLLGQLSLSVFFQRFSFLVALVGVIFVIGGWNLFKQLSFPLLLLALMIPGPEGITKKLTFPLQLTSSSLAATFLQMVGVPVLRQGNVIDLGTRQLQVVQACSGLRYILSLMALGIIYCYFYQRSLWKAVLILIFLIPAAIVANALRVAGMGIFPSLQEGFLHQFSGWLIFLFCFAFMGLINWLLNFLRPQSTKVIDDPGPQGTATNHAVPDKRASHGYYVLGAIALLLIFGQVDRTLSKVEPLPPLKSLDSFPLQLGDWHGQSSKIREDILKVTEADSYFNAEYIAPSKYPVGLWIAFYGRHSRGILSHNPKVCMVGSGWRIIDSKIQYVADGLPVNALLLENSGERTLVYYWYLQQGRWVAKITKPFTIGLSGLIRRRTDFVLIRLVIPLQPDQQTATEHLNSFTRLLIPVIPQFFQK